jgi:hypothetical protein
VRARRNLGFARQRAHRRREPADLVGRLAFLAQRREQRARERGRHFARGHELEERVRARLVEAFAAQQPLEQLRRVDAHG